MDFTPNEDQTAFFAMLDRMIEAPEAGWAVAPDHARFAWSATLDATLDANGFYDAANEETLGPVAAAELVRRLARLPVVVECAASALLRSALPADLPRPLAVLEEAAGEPVRFLPQARSVLRLGPGRAAIARPAPGQVVTVDSLFAYPMGRFTERGPDWEPIDADPAALADLWRIAIAAEMAGALDGALDSVVNHVRDRRQFGRPLGSFQTIQHRLAEAATRIEGARLLVLKAAEHRTPTEAAIALGYVQDIATRVIYDLHQFMGAMGLTLEHPLHRWTYRVRLLRSAFGGAARNFDMAAGLRWTASPSAASTSG